VTEYYEHEVLGYTDTGNSLTDGPSPSQEKHYPTELERILKVHHRHHMDHRQDFVLDRLNDGHACKKTSEISVNIC
jgi:hypothetical protein